jgi:hypothetical protein
MAFPPRPAGIGAVVLRDSHRDAESMSAPGVLKQRRRVWNADMRRVLFLTITLATHYSGCVLCDFVKPGNLNSPNGEPEIHEQELDKKHPGMYS